MRAIWIVAATAVIALQGSPQDVPGSIEGTVLQSGSNAPIALVRIALFNSRGMAIGSEMTDTGGHFSFASLPAENYFVSLSRDGYFLPGSGQLHLINTAGVTPVDGQIKVGSREHVQNVHIEIVATGTISGRLVDPDGTPAANFKLQLLELHYQNGAPLYEAIDRGPVTSGSDDRGEYRLYSVPPGSYIVVAQPLAARVPAGDGSFATYFPSAVNPLNAVPVVVEGGKEVPNINIAMRRGPMSSIAISVIPSSPVISVTKVVAKLTPVRSDGAVGVSNSCILRYCPLNSPFAIANVPEGTYSLDVIRQGRDVDSSGQAAVVVGQQPVSTVVTLRDGVEVKGRATIRSNSNIRSFQLGIQSYESIGSTFPSLRRLLQLNDEGDNNGSFVLQGMTPGRYSMVPIQNNGEYVVDVRQGGRSIMDSGLTIGTEPPDPVEVMLGVGTSTITGTIQNGQRAAVAFNRAVLIPSASQRGNYSLYKSAIADFAGRFTISDVPPGDYKLFAWAHVPNGAWTNTDFMQKYEDRGIVVTVKPNEDFRDAHVTIIPAQ